MPQSKHYKQKTMVEALKNDTNVKALNTSELKRTPSRKIRSASLHPGAAFHSNKLSQKSSSTVRRKKFSRNYKDKCQNAQFENGSNDCIRGNSTNTLNSISSEGRMFHSGEHTTVDIHDQPDDEGESRSLLLNHHHHHHVHLPKLSLSPPDTKVSFL